MERMHLTAAMPLLAISTWRSRIVELQLVRSCHKYYCTYTYVLDDFTTLWWSFYFVAVWCKHTKTKFALLQNSSFVCYKEVIKIQFWIRHDSFQRRTRWQKIVTFSITLLPPKRVTNSAGEATVKSLWRSIRRRSLPCFTRCSPDMLGLFWEIGRRF